MVTRRWHCLHICGLICRCYRCCCRTPQEFAAGHVKDSVNIPLMLSTPEGEVSRARIPLLLAPTSVGRTMGSPCCIHGLRCPYNGTARSAPLLPTTLSWQPHCHYTLSVRAGMQPNPEFLQAVQAKFPDTTAQLVVVSGSKARPFALGGASIKPCI